MEMNGRKTDDVKDPLERVNSHYTQQHCNKLTDKQNNARNVTTPTDKNTHEQGIQIIHTQKAILSLQTEAE